MNEFHLKVLALHTKSSSMTRYDSTEYRTMKHISYNIQYSFPLISFKITCTYLIKIFLFKLYWEKLFIKKCKKHLPKEDKDLIKITSYIASGFIMHVVPGQ